MMLKDIQLRLTVFYLRVDTVSVWSVFTKSLKSIMLILMPQEFPLPNASPILMLQDFPLISAIPILMLQTLPLNNAIPILMLQEFPLINAVPILMLQDSAKSYEGATEPHNPVTVNITVNNSQHHSQHPPVKSLFY